MIDRECQVCSEYSSDVWTLEVSDERNKIHISGHKSCIDELDIKVKSIKNVKKLPLEKVLKIIGFSNENS